MQLESIVTLANARVRLRFLALERSLRATGCDLPLRVIPYDDARFELPRGATWWEDDTVLPFLDRHRAHRMMRKYLCLTIGNYQFVDSDVVFLRSPADVLADCEGWVASCLTWRSPEHAITPRVRAVMAARSTLWQQRVFNAGQFACDRALYAPARLLETLADPANAPTALHFPYHDQPGLNLLVALSGVAVSNLTLPPGLMESTWAGDYPGAFDHLWREEARKPYLMHWAGHGSSTARPVDALYLDFLTAAERREWQAEIAGHHRVSLASRGRGYLHLARRACREAWSVWRTGRTVRERENES